jgi:ABC-2 type transport system permease protein
LQAGQRFSAGVWLIKKFQENKTMRFIDLAIKDLMQVVRDVKVVLFLVIMPFGFTAIMGLALNSPEPDPRLAIGFADLDEGGFIGAELRSLLETSQTIRLVDLDPPQTEEANRLIENGDLVAAVIVPQGYGQDLLAGESARLTVIDGSQGSASQTVQVTLQTAATRLISALQTARLSVEALEARQPFTVQAERDGALQEALRQTIQAWSAPPFTLKLENMGSETEEAQDSVPSGFRQTSPGMIIQFAIFGLMMTASVIVLERRTKALQRMLTTSISRAEIIAGHLLSSFVVVFLQVLLLVVAGQLVFNVGYMQDPLAVLLVTLGLCAWIAAMGLFIGVIAKVEEQAVLFSLISMFVLTAFAGAWFPLEVTGKAFNTIGHITPGAWAMDGFQNIVLRGQGLDSVLLPVGVLLAYAALFFFLAVWQFKYE